jgi:hypothetical protein
VTRWDWLFTLAPFVVLATIAVYAARHERTYHCRARGCGRTFIDPLERSAHFRRSHLS